MYCGSDAAGRIEAAHPGAVQHGLGVGVEDGGEAALDPEVVAAATALDHQGDGLAADGDDVLDVEALGAQVIGEGVGRGAEEGDGAGGSRTASRSRAEAISSALSGEATGAGSVATAATLS